MPNLCGGDVENNGPKEPFSSLNVSWDSKFWVLGSVAIVVTVVSLVKAVSVLVVLVSVSVQTTVQCYLTGEAVCRLQGLKYPKCH